MRSKMELKNRTYSTLIFICESRNIGKYQIHKRQILRKLMTNWLLKSERLLIKSSDTYKVYISLKQLMKFHAV